MHECDRFGTFGQCHIQCSIQMHFEQTDAANASRVQKFPVIHQMRLFFNGELSL
jgi:hypothetical protein